MSSPLWKVSAAVACLLAAFSVNANAQECGDADGNGSVTVTDGVQALRAAAGLSSTCGATCDVDGSGSVTVTDGVNILRKAAGIAIAESCGFNGQVQALLKQTLPLFGSLTKVSTGASAQAAGDSGCENPDGQIEIDQANNEIDFFDCVIEGISYDGSVSVDPDTSTLFLDLDFTIVATDESFSFFGDFTLTQSGSNDVLSGSLDISFDNFGDLSVAFDNVVSDVDGNLIGGAVVFDATDSDIDGVAAIRVGFTTSTTLPVSVTLTDQSTLNFTFDLNSGVLSPVS
jgi:hypothetical protein